MTALPNDSARGETADASARGIKERVLVFIVAFLGLLIVAGLIAVVLKIIYLSSAPPAQRAMSEGEGAAARVAVDRLDLPPGAVVKSTSVSGDRLAVYFEAPGEAGIAVLDLATGTVLRRVDVVPGGAGR